MDKELLQKEIKHSGEQKIIDKTIMDCADLIQSLLCFRDNGLMKNYEKVKDGIGKVKLRTQQLELLGFSPKYYVEYHTEQLRKSMYALERRGVL